LLHPCSLGHVQQSTLTSAVSVRLQFAVYVFFSFAGEVVQSAQGLHWIIFLGGRKGSLTWCVILIFSFCSFTQTTLELTGVGKWPSFFNAVLLRGNFHQLGVQDVAEFDSD
jgi:hypothetical protein